MDQPSRNRPIFAIIPYEPAHLAMMTPRVEQMGEAARFGQAAGAAAELGPAFTATETDDDGQVTMLACAGLAENSADYATAWACFAEGLRPAQYSALAAAMRRALAESGYARIDLIARADFAAAHRFALWLGFSRDAVIYARESQGRLALDVPRETAGPEAH